MTGLPYAIRCTTEHLKGFVNGYYILQGNKYLTTKRLYKGLDVNKVESDGVSSIKTYTSKARAENGLKAYENSYNIGFDELAVVQLEDYEYQQIEPAKKLNVKSKKEEIDLTKYFKELNLKCSKCHNTDLKEMVVSQRVFKRLSDLSKVDKKSGFKDEIEIYCNICESQVL